MQLEKATSHSGEAGLAGWISSNDVTLFTVVMVIVVAVFLQANVIKGSKQNKQLQGKNREDELRIQQITANLTSTRDELATTAQRLLAATADLEQTRRRLTETQQNLDQMRQALDATNKAKQDLEAKRQQLDEQLAAAKRDIQAARDLLAALTTEKTQLMAATQDLTRDKDTLSQEKDELTKTKQSLDSSLAELNAKLKERLKDLDDLKRERDLLDQQALALAERVKNLEQQLGTSEKQMSEIKKTSDTETASLRELLARALEQSKTDKTAAVQVTQAAKDATTRADDYYDRLKRAAVYVRGVDEKKRLLELEVEALKVQLANALDRAKATQDQLALRRRQEKTVHQELVGLRGSLRRVAIILDSSGSMNEGGRWEEVQRTTAAWLQHLEFDQCVLIVFASTVRVFPEDGSLLSVTGPDGDANRQRLLSYLKTVKPEGATNTLAAMQTVYRYPGLGTVVLFSDGAPTEPNSNKFSPQMAEQIYALCRQHVEIPVNTIGVGNYFDRDLATFLRTVSQLTGGTFLGR